MNKIINDYLIRWVRKTCLSIALYLNFKHSFIYFLVQYKTILWHNILNKIINIKRYLYSVIISFIITDFVLIAFAWVVSSPQAYVTTALYPLQMWKNVSLVRKICLNLYYNIYSYPKAICGNRTSRNRLERL